MNKGSYFAFPLHCKKEPIHVRICAFVKKKSHKFFVCVYSLNINVAGFMNKFNILLQFFFIIALSSCNLVNDLVPDVDTSFSKTFQIQIFSNAGKTVYQLVDITKSDEYNDYKNNIEGYELQKITYKIKKDNVPSDMYFSGSVICSNEEETKSYPIGSIPNVKISEMALSSKEYAINEISQKFDEVLTWLETPGKFKIRTDYVLTAENGSPYTINGTNTGSNFELEVLFYVTVKTKIK